MRFRRVIILGGGFGATPIHTAAHFISVFLINAITLNALIAPPGNAARPEARAIRQQDDRIIPLLAPLADQAGLSADLTFAVRAQSQAATLLWLYDREQARAIYRRAFQSLVCDDGVASKTASVDGSSPLEITTTARQRLLVELLKEIAGRDSGLAEDLAHSTVLGNREDDSSHVFNASRPTDPALSDAERRDLLANVALQLVERDPARAMALGQSSLAFGVSPHISRLLLSLSATDAERTELLFAYAVGCLERSRHVDLNGLHALGAFLVSTSDLPAKESVDRGVVLRFLNCALAQLTRRGQMAAGRRGDVPANQGMAAEDEAVIYFIGRQLGGLFARYMPDRLGQFKRKIAELSATDPNGPVVAPAPVYASNPNEVAREARAASTPADRDLLNARAAFAWLARGEVSRAQAAAAKVAAGAIRDRVMIQVARQYNSARRLDDAVAATRCVRDAVARANLLISFAGAALASKDETRATDLLNEASGCALMARPAMARARALVGIAGSFVAFDARRGFAVMEMAVKAINDVLAQREASEPALSNPGAAGEFETGELYGPGLEAAFAALGRADFERAWSLAQQLTVRDISVLAQLAVCRGGLARN